MYAMPSSERDLEALAKAVAERRVELAMPKVEVARAAGITVTTYHQIEAGRPVRDSTYGKIEPVLKWAPGSCRAVLDGDGPVTVEPGPTPGTVFATIPEDDLRKDIVGAVVAVTDDLTAAQIRDLSQRVVEELRKRGKI